MNWSSAARAAALLFPMMILTGCAANRAGDALRQEAAARQGTADAGVAIAPQPSECREECELLPRTDLVGREALSGIDRYEVYITDEINPTKRRCWQFNEDIRTGLTRGAGKGLQQ